MQLLLSFIEIHRNELSDELHEIFSFHKSKIKPNAFAKINQRILEKLEANRPALKEGYEKVQDGWPSISNKQEAE